MNERLIFNPKQLTSARIARGLTMKELAEKAELSRQMISNYESGKTIPKADSILKLISVLQFPRSFFSADTFELYSGATFFRSRSAATKKVRDMQKERLKYVQEVYKVLATYVNFPKVCLPELIEKSIYEITEEEIVKKAEELRKIWGLDLISPVPNLIQLAEQNGVIISEANMSNPTLDAVSRWMIGRPFIMLTDNHESAVRRRFNVAHELGHILLHNGVESIHEYSQTELKNIIEYQANLFAAHFLLPSAAFSDSLLSISLEYYIDLKKYWKVSLQSMIQKTYTLALINDDQRLYLNKRIAKNKWKTKEPHDEQLTIEQPEVFQKVYHMILEHQVIPASQLNQAFKLPKEEIEKILGTAIQTEQDKTEIVLELLRSNE